MTKSYGLLIESFQLSQCISPAFSPPQIEEQIESMFNSKKRVKDLSAPGATSGSAGSTSSTSSASGGLPGLGPTSAGNIQKLEMAKRLALKINAQKNLGAEAQVRRMPEETWRGFSISKCSVNPHLLYLVILNAVVFQSHCWPFVRRTPTFQMF